MYAVPSTPRVDLRDEVVSRSQRLERQNAELARALARAEAQRQAAEAVNGEMVRRLQELESRNKELDAFAQTVAHDIKSPLSIIASYATFLAEDDQEGSPAEQAEMLEVIDKHATCLTQVVDALLLLAQVEELEVPLRPVHMGALLDRVMERLAGQIKESGAEIVLPPAAAWPAALGYGPWIEEIWINYLGNGFRYGGAPPRLVLGGELLANGQSRFWVRDHGPGISPADQARLFAPYAQLGRLNGDGYGLGLSIVRRIVDKLGGQAGVESVAGQGSLFYFTLPAAGGAPADEAAGW